MDASLETLDGLKMQTYKDINVQPVRAGKPTTELGKDWYEKQKNVCMSRNACLDRLIDRDFGVIQDSGSIHLFSDNLLLMIDALMLDRELVAVALRKNDDQRMEHIATGCVMFSYAFHRLGMRYRYEKEHCDCWCMTKDIHDAGYKIGYVDDKVRINNTGNHLYREVECLTR